jgi:2,3-bisphosphoglycerate-dependent phosphoglycerate mutase
VQLLLVRHGRPEQVITTDGSPADPPLSALGRRQAEAMSQWLAEERIDALYSSPMQRARETAVPVEHNSGLNTRVREGLSEFDRASTAYVPMEVLKETDREAWDNLVATGFVSDDGSWSKRVVETIDTIVSECSGQRVAVMCHGGVVNAYVAHCLGLAPEKFMNFDVDYTSVSRVLASSRGHRSVLTINERTHFRGRPDLIARA